jgi:hypothetical protein
MVWGFGITALNMLQKILFVAGLLGNTLYSAAFLEKCTHDGLVIFA